MLFPEGKEAASGLGVQVEVDAAVGCVENRSFLLALQIYNE